MFDYFALFVPHLLFSKLHLEKYIMKNSKLPYVSDINSKQENFDFIPTSSPKCAGDGVGFILGCTTTHNNHVP